MRLQFLLVVVCSLIVVKQSYGQQLPPAQPLAIGNGLLPGAPVATVEYGDTVVLEMRGKIASVYIKLLGHDVPNDVPSESIGTSLEGRVIKSTSDGVIVECHVVSKPNTTAARVITVTATLPRDDIKFPTPYSQPSSSTTTEIQKQILHERTRLARLPYVRIDTFDKTKIRTWTFERDVNE